MKKTCPVCEVKLIASVSKMCKSCSNRARAGKYFNKGGWKHSQEYKDYMSKLVTGTRRSEVTKEKIRIASVVRWSSPDQRTAQSARRKEALADPTKHPNWKGGITPEFKKIRASDEYKQWRISVFERDGYTCVHCGDNRGGNLEADHIKPFAYFPNSRFDVSNGRTLCHDCHVKTPTYGGKARRMEYA